MNLLSTRLLTFCALAAAVPCGALAQTASQELSSLPDAPSALVAPAEAMAGGAPNSPPKTVAKKYATVILPSETAPRLTAKDKVVSGLISTVSPTAALGWLVSSGYSYVTNGSPNYPQTGKGYAQNLGAAAARATSETVFGNAVLAPILHEDARYYKMGRGNNFLKRTAYAVTRPVITRTDGGHQTLNLWDLGGDFAGSALTPVYYPPLNTSFTEVLKTFGGSVGGDAVGDLVSEFLGDILQIVHIGHAN